MRFTNETRKDGTPREFGLQFNPNGTVELMEYTPQGTWNFKKCWANNSITSWRLIAREAAGDEPVANLDEFLLRIEAAADRVVAALNEATVL